MSEVLPPEPKPTLHEIAAMPFPDSQNAMRKHYCADWHKEAAEGKRRFAIKADWSMEGTFSETIEAEDEAEARSLAKEYILEDLCSGDLDVTFRSVEAQP